MKYINKEVLDLFFDVAQNSRSSTYFYILLHTGLVLENYVLYDGKISILKIQKFTYIKQSTEQNVFSMRMEKN